MIAHNKNSCEINPSLPMWACIYNLKHFIAVISPGSDFILICVLMCVCVQRPNGIRFIRLHIPWPILSREAELQKIKVAVKKVSAFALAKGRFHSTCLTFLFDVCGTVQS